MRNHHFSADYTFYTVATLLTEVEAFLGEAISVEIFDTNEPAWLGKRTFAANLAAYAGGWCKCSGDVVMAFPRIMECGSNWEHAPRPLRQSAAYDVHGQSALYVVRDNGKLRAFYA